MANHAILFDETTFPSEFVKEFTRDRCLPMFISDDDKISVIFIWDINLFFYFNWRTHSQQIKVQFYEDYPIKANSKPRNQIDVPLMTKHYDDFLKGFQTGNSTKHLNESLDFDIWPLSRSDENIKASAMRLIDAYSTRVEFRSFAFDGPDYFLQLGLAHGLYSTLNQIADKHRWQRSGNTERRTTIPPSVVELLKSLMTDKGVLNNKSNNPKSGSTIAFILDGLKVLYGVDKSAILRQVKPIWNLRSVDLNNYKYAKNLKKRREHEQLANSILNLAKTGEK